MDRWIENIKLTLRYFPRITTAVTAITAGYITVFYGTDTELGVELLWQILIVSLLCSLCSLFFCHRGKKELEKKAFLFRWGICYLYVNMVVLGLGCYFDWFEPSDLAMVIGMEIAILIVFAILAVSVFLIDLGTTDEINRKLKEREK